MVPENGHIMGSYDQADSREREELSLFTLIDPSLST